MEVTPQDIIDAALHVFRPDATEAELEGDAPRILAFACRQGMEITHLAFTGSVIDVTAVHADFLSRDLGDPCVWQEVAPLVSSLALEGQQIL
jgi:hypothetical protein